MKIGFADFYLGEWHADNYPKWINAASEKLGLDYHVEYAWAEQDTSPVENITTDEWCEKMGVKRCATLDELCEKSDYLIVLAPSDPDKHLGYAETVLKYKKRTYIDKTFAQNLETAEKIFALGEEYGTPFFSTSALRYAEELKTFTDVKKLVLTGGGRTFDEYSIHMIEMAIVLLKTRVKRVRAEKLGQQLFCRAEAENGEEAMLIFSPPLGFSVLAEDPAGKSRRADIRSEFFFELICDILRFFETGKKPFDSNQTLEVMRLRDACLKAEKNLNEWIEL